MSTVEIEMSGKHRVEKDSQEFVELQDVLVAGIAPLNDVTFSVRLTGRTPFISFSKMRTSHQYVQNARKSALH